MKLLIFTEGTILMHESAIGKLRKEIVRQVIEKDPSVKDYYNYVPIKNAVQKLKEWQEKGAKIYYLTSRKSKEEVKAIESVLKKFNFPKGKLLFRKELETYTKIAEKLNPKVIIEDDCESIGGKTEMIYPNLKNEAKERIRLIAVKEFGGIDEIKLF